MSMFILNLVVRDDFARSKNFGEALFIFNVNFFSITKLDLLFALSD